MCVHGLEVLIIEALAFAVYIDSATQPMLALHYRDVDAGSREKEEMARGLRTFFST